MCTLNKKTITISIISILMTVMMSAMQWNTSNLMQSEVSTQKPCLTEIKLKSPVYIMYVFFFNH